MTAFAIIGFGEVGSRFARDLHEAGATGIAAFDVEADAQSRARASRHATPAPTAAAAAAAADVVIVAVTSGSVLQAVEALGDLRHHPFVLDVNSVSPATKRGAAERVEAAGGRYVEAAIMSSVAPRGLRSPMLLGGPHAAAFASLVAPLGLDLTAFDGPVVGASSVKMCRSVMIKGLEALALEALVSARRYGVERQVLDSLSDTLPGQDWPALARYLVGRALIHGRRRSEEMREVAVTVREAGVEPLLSVAIADRQAWAGRQGGALDGSVLSDGSLGRVLDALLDRTSRDGALDGDPSSHAETFP